jgi:glucose-fructose oxidoreductase
MRKKRKGMRQARQVRYAAVGLGHIAQVALLPAFTHAGSNSQLTGLVSGDPKKLKTLSQRYGVPHAYSYEQYEQCLREGHIDAVYIALPNSMHCDYMIYSESWYPCPVRKAMAVPERECRQMVSAAERARTKLMIAYRLHLEEANVNVVELARSGKLGKLRMFNATFSMHVRKGDIRLKRAMGGGSLYDIGIYCINAARYLLQENPIEVSTFSVKGTDRRFREVDEMSGALLCFPDGKLASFLWSFGAADVSSYELVGTKGHLQLNLAFEYVGSLTQRLTLHGHTRTKRFLAGDQFAAELIDFSDCIRRNKDPEPSGTEGLIDVQIIEALYRSSEQRKPIKLKLPAKGSWPTKRQVIRRPPVHKPSLVHTQSPSQQLRA